MTGLPDNKYRNDLEESPAAKALKQQGKAIDEANLVSINGNVYRRVLYGAARPEDIPKDFNEPRALFNSLSAFARNGPRELVAEEIQPREITVTVTGAAGAIGYALLPRLCKFVFFFREFLY